MSNITEWYTRHAEKLNKKYYTKGTHRTYDT